MKINAVLFHFLFPSPYHREEESLVDIFVIEMLVVMVNSLKLAHKDDKSLGKR